MPNTTEAEILIVDDMPNNLRLLSQMLSAQGYRVRAATSGPRALEAVRAAPPDMILLDIRMPQMDGYEVCAKLKADPQTRDIPIIFISALDEIQDKVRAFGIGGVDYITKPFQLEEVLARVGTHLSLRKLQRQLQDANQRFARELALAGKIQLGILPRELPGLPGWDLGAALLSARETSGDFYDIAVLPNGGLMMVVADVVDKGAGAALYMALVCTLIRTFAAQYPADPDLVLEAANHRLRTDIESDEFVTMFYSVLDPKTGVLAYCNAGHNPPFVFAANGEAWPLRRTGYVLGLLDRARWERAETRLSPRDTLVLYTDGITEADNGDGELFGVDRLLDCVKQNAACSAAEIGDCIISSVERFTFKTQRSDDLTLVIAKRK